jgi:hypothetical protein
MTRPALARMLVCGSAALATLLPACANPAKREAATLVDAVDRFRRADDASKATQVQAIAGVACTDAKVCDAKQSCLAAADATARAFALKDEVARRLGDIEQKRLAPDAPEAKALPGQLDEAQKLLEQGRAKMPDCEKKLADLRVNYGV